MGEGLRLRRGVRAVVLDDADRVLLVHFRFSADHGADRELWATPGGGVEDGEDDVAALRRELAEEAGLGEAAIGPCIWTRTHVVPIFSGAYDGQVERLHLVRTPAVEPRPTMTEAELLAENVLGLRWWTVDELVAATGVVFAPRRLPALVATLVAEGPPSSPVDVGV